MRRGRCAAHATETERWRESSAARGYGSPEWLKLRLRVLAEEPFCRNLCGRPATEVDHILPKGAGGTDDRANLQGLCKPCHSRKTLAEQRAGLTRRSR